MRIGLTLSGGGLRAAAFHLGIVSRLASAELRHIA
jgi:predicted acylesterase/phospholipase RssA